MKRYVGLLGLLALLSAGCSPAPSATPGEQIRSAEDQLLGEANATMDGALNAFSDLAPASAAAQASTEERPMLLAYNGAEKVLIGGPWRPPFPWPINTGIEDLVGKPLFLVAEKAPNTGLMTYLGVLRRSSRGTGYEVEWYGRQGSQPVRTPVVVQQDGQLGSPTGKEKPKIKIRFSFNPITKEVDIIIIIEPKDPKDNLDDPPVNLRLVTSKPPRELPGRPIEDRTNPEGFLARFKEICCGRPKPFPPIKEPWPILLRNDLTMVAVPYENPKLNAPRTIDDVMNADVALLYMRKRPPTGTTTDCGPMGVWCPPDRDPFYNLRVRPDRQGGHVTLLRMADRPIEEIARFPAEFSISDQPGYAIGIEDDVAAPEAPLLTIKTRSLQSRMQTK
ncbi:hypothetical protein [Thermus igniterrae]|uniref:hypothetical protein n=1 Tax=Thermus igniterrae TaxID=88189 RepID=UPI0003620427|nr:hypothetical protein [Thermus igniterrae]